MVLANEFRLRSVRFIGDSGELIEGVDRPPRWRPRLTLCQSSLDGVVTSERAIVKYRRCNLSSAANISELVSTLLLRRSGIKTVVPLLVYVDEDDVLKLRRSMDYVPYEGVHYGSVFDPRLQEVDTETWAFDLLWRPTEYAKLWVMDSLLMNHDRYSSPGNARLGLPTDPNGKWRLIAVDQSDCFYGAGFLSDGTFREKCRQSTPVPWPGPMQRLIDDEGAQPLRMAIRAAEGAMEHLDKIVGLVPGEWWSHAGVRPEWIVGCLKDRCLRLADIVELRTWEGLKGASDGGIILI